FSAAYASERPRRSAASPDELAQVREVDDRAAHQDVRDGERAEARVARGQDVVVLRERGRREPGLPGEDLEVPGPARVPDLGRDEVQHIAVRGVVREARRVGGTLYGRRV